MKKTIIDLFEGSVEKYGAKTFLLEKKHRAFEPTTYAETKELCLLYTSPSPRDMRRSRMPSSA